MRTSPLVLLLLAGPPSAGASRLSEVREHVSEHQGASSRTDASWAKHSQRFCLTSEAKLECDEYSIIQVYSAFYGRSSMGQTCEPLQPNGGVESCSKNATDAVVAKCEGQQQCALPPSFHPICNAHLSMRVVWECVTGSPPTAVADLHHPESPEEELEKNHQEEEQTKVIEPVKSDWATVEKVSKLKKKPDFTVDFNPCYRRSRWQLVRMMTPFARLTTCPANEGCFQLQWGDGRTYEDPQEPPSKADMLQSNLAPGRNLWVSWWGIGIKRNDYYTWGVCLPVNEGVTFAIGVFNSLKEY